MTKARLAETAYDCGGWLRWCDPSSQSPFPIPPIKLKTTPADPGAPRLDPRSLPGYTTPLPPPVVTMFRWLLRLLGIGGKDPETSPPSASESPEVGPSAAPSGPVVNLPPQREERALLPAPWLGAEPVPTTDPAQLRGQLRLILDEISGRATHPADRALAEHLNRLVQTDQLDLPPFPDVARELDELLKQTTTDILQIARVVERDPGLVRRVWTHARSAAYSSAPRSLHHAVARVGLDALWRIGMSVCLNETVFQVEGYQEQADRVRQHGIVTGEIAAMLGGERRGALYLAGLLHGVGELIVLRAAAGLPGGRPTSAGLEEVNRRCRAALGVLVAHSWSLGQPVCAAVGSSPAPDRAPPEDRPAARIVRSASIAAHSSWGDRHGLQYDAVDPRKDIRGMGFDPDLTLRRADEMWASLEAESQHGEPA